ncbi:NAD-binding protein [Mycobacterium malmoense]|uniref:NAD-binding protein n=1 Tax=Mycobacterium malmoense TaxID=1780 RepID=UPI0009F2C949|nr:NAD-binding protein [Mycobacterium malmoense]
MSNGDNDSQPPGPGAYASAAGAPSQAQRPGKDLPPTRKSANTAAAALNGFWRDYQWWMVGLAAVAAFVLGFVGFFEHDASPTDAVYNSLKLFIFHESEANTGVGVCVNIARFLAPAVAGYAALVALGSLFYERWLQMKGARRHGHIVLCGLGYVGSAFLEALLAARKRVVVIEKDAENPNRQLCRRRGVPVIVGDAQQKGILQAAGIERAARLLAATPDDAVNAEIVARAQELITLKAARGRRRQTVITRRRGTGLSCLARIGDPDLCTWLRIAEAKRHDASSALDFFNPYDISGRLMLEEFPYDTQHGRPHILVAHPDAAGARLIFYAARQWHDLRSDNTVPLLVTVVDDHAEQQVDALVGEYPVLENEKVCEFVTCSASVRGVQGRLANQGPGISRAYVTAYDDAQGLETALKLRREFDALNSKVPLVVALSGAEGLASLVKNSGPSGMDVFLTLERTCDADFAAGGSFEIMARAIHNRYGDIQGGKAKPPQWSKLDESFKASNRGQARHIAVKLNEIGYQIVPLCNWGAMDFTFTPEEVDKLAEMEHDRWWEERRADRWKWGEKRNDELRENPYMVNWHELPAEIAEWDRVFVRAIPSLLASVGLQVVPVPAT